MQDLTRLRVLCGSTLLLAITACCLTAAGLFVSSEGKPSRWRTPAALGASVLLVYASATRFNAMFATAPLLVAWLPEAWLRGWWRTGI